MCRGGGGICQVGCASWREGESAGRILEDDTSRFSGFRAIYCMRKYNVCVSNVRANNTILMCGRKYGQISPIFSLSVLCDSPLPVLPYSEQMFYSASVHHPGGESTFGVSRGRTKWESILYKRDMNAVT